MNYIEVDRILKRIGAKPIDNATQLGTFAVVEANKFTTKGISNRDNARWKRAQFIVVEYCPASNVSTCLRGFLQFSESCQYLIVANTNQIFNGYGKAADISQLTICK